MSRSVLVAWAIFLAGVALVVAYYFMTLPGGAPAEVRAERAEAGGPRLELTIDGEAQGKVVIELFPNIAPKHVERIVTLAREGAYDGVVFHRVIDGFMAQTGDVEFGKLGGDLRRAGQGGSRYPDLPAEFSKEPFVAGIVGMARSASPDSANSQFFIMFDKAPHLDGQYTVVGRVIEGMDVVNAIKRGTGPNGAVIGKPDVIVQARVQE
ncbi:MAG: peptidylprolyl isomerase [Alphaproteobacteria bacterium]|nr:MAG: peptidylprolyl isomerase [Alphaproteobacteria bacterium]